jgi:hypothetical protein
MVTGLLKKITGQTVPTVKKPEDIDTNGVPAKANSTRAITASNQAEKISAINAKQDVPDSAPLYKGDPDDQVIVFDMDETLIAGDKTPLVGARAIKVNGMGDREISTIKKGDPINKLPFDIRYVLRPGVQEVLEYLTSRGYKIIVSTRNFQEYGEAICKHNPILAKHVSGVLGREDLMVDENKDFKKYPNHPDHFGFFGKLKNAFLNYCIHGPKHLWLKFKSIFNGSNIRWSPSYGALGKYPPNMIELLKLRGNNKLNGFRPPRILVDNKATRSLRDSNKSSDFAVINPDVDANGDGKPEDFHADSRTIKTKVKDPETGEEKEVYLWVKNVIESIERGWKGQFKHTTGREPKEISKQP